MLGKKIRNKNTRMSILTTLRQAAAILLFSTGCAFLCNTVSPRGIALVGEWDTSKGVISAVSKEKPVVHDLEISDPEVARKIFDSGTALFVDARSEEMFAEGHIKGAVSLPVGSFDDKIEVFINEYPSSTPMVTYCTGRECEDSHFLMQLLSDAGYENITVFIDGYPTWADRGYPVGIGAK